VIINGQTIGGSGSDVVNTDGLVKAINQSSAGVSASLTAQGSIVLTSNVPGADIRIGPSTNNGVLQNQFNALQLSDGVYRGHISLTSAQEIKIAVMPLGGAADLARMGLRTGAYVDGAAPEDLVVFSTGTGPASVAGSYKIAPFDAIASARKEQLKIQFTSPTTYTITDLATNAEMANRTYDPAAGIQIGGRLVQLSGTPATGDQFVLDGNQNGVGNNQNIVRIVDLKDAAITPDGKTIGVAYNDLVSTIGNVASQATVAQQAMQAVTQQAEKTRDTASGVNLDQEAADLVRFQQAYQAAAKTMQVAAQLFDYIAQIR
jgi:flagellar hook-associated protein FlgK